MSDEKNTSELAAPSDDFYRSAYKSRLSLLILMILLNAVLFVWIYYWITHPTKPDYFMVMSEGRLDKMTSLDEPVVTSNELLQWATISATTVNTYNFVNWRKVFQEASANFTPEGWGEFQDALHTSLTLDTVTSKKLSVSAVATGAPVILEKGILSGAYKWKVQLPLLLTYESASQTTSHPVVATMLITRTTSPDIVRGIAIEAFYMIDETAIPTPSSKR